MKARNTFPLKRNRNQARCILHKAAHIGQFMTSWVHEASGTSTRLSQLHHGPVPIKSAVGKHTTTRGPITCARPTVLCALKDQKVRQIGGMHFASYSTSLSTPQSGALHPSVAPSSTGLTPHVPIFITEAHARNQIYHVSSLENCTKNHESIKKCSLAYEVEKPQIFILSKPKTLAAFGGGRAKGLPVACISALMRR